MLKACMSTVTVAFTPEGPQRKQWPYKSLYVPIATEFKPQKRNYVDTRLRYWACSLVGVILVTLLITIGISHLVDTDPPPPPPTSPPAMPPPSPPHIVIMVESSEPPLPSDPVSHVDIWASTQYTVQYGGNHTHRQGDVAWWEPVDGCLNSSMPNGGGSEDGRGGVLDGALINEVNLPDGDYVLCLLQNQTTTEHSHVTLAVHSSPPSTPPHPPAPPLPPHSPAPLLPPFVPGTIPGCWWCV